MKYDWEKKLETNFDFDGCSEYLNQWFGLGNKVKPKIMGVIVANTVDNEACLVVNPEFNKQKNVGIADLWLDAGGDVQAQRAKAMNNDN